MKSATLSCNGFTLIELLVVVLIIGILAAVAMPQYSRAVEKSRSTQALTLLQPIITAYEAYYMANGSFPTNFDQLDVDMTAWTGNTQWYIYASDTRSNEDWSLQLQPGTVISGFYMGRLSGKYKGGGFGYYLVNNLNGVPNNELLCFERIGSGVKFTQPEGAYCKVLFKGTKVFANGGARIYTLPK